ncbi:PAS domain-containing sensor histidine kinase [Candidatus Paracaedibacter symbiosus]|uniref:PAS domain-containing sensor histidine kinase n=1 Tax=Candidatus Paracaedibacter symbiosus TaxID=244582 RepID=UPI000509DEEF|nr:PAS domain-containing sensor histidine kinase [Candidatus Paracaedibacter symbiosus]
MDKSFGPNTLLESYSPSEGILLEFIAPYIYTLSELMAEKDPEMSTDQYSYAYISSFIKKAKINIGFIDSEGVFKVVSSSFNQWFAQRIKKGFDIVNKNITDVFEEVPQEISQGLEKNLKGSIVKYKEVPITIAKDRQLWITWESFPWVKTNGDIAGIVFFCKDITEQKELYLDVRKLYSRTELLEKFSLIFSHDLIQPLRQISTYVSFLEMELDTVTKNTPTVNENIKALNRCVSRAKEICEGVIIYCKNGDLTINREPVDLSEIMNIIAGCCSDRSDIIIKDFTSPDLILDVNKSCVLQLFQNLLDNAIKHSTTTPIEITFSGHHLDENYYEFSLHNNGWCGHTLKQKNVFNAFYSNFADGAGLGLMICKKIVNAYGGEIRFISLPEEGTKITFSLPLFKEIENVVDYNLRTVKL